DAKGRRLVKDDRNKAHALHVLAVAQRRLQRVDPALRRLQRVRQLRRSGSPPTAHVASASVSASVSVSVSASVSASISVSASASRLFASSSHSSALRAPDTAPSSSPSRLIRNVVGTAVITEESIPRNPSGISRGYSAFASAISARAS